MNINEKEVLRYLGYRNHQADESVSGYIKELAAELQTCLNPKSVYEKFTCGVDLSGIVRIENIVIKSKSLAAHMRDCEWVVLLAVTLGTEADTVIRRYSVIDAAKAAVAQAVCTVMLENLCDALECQIAAEESASGNYLKPRFSPGYGDFELCHQKDILSLLERKKRIGITLTDGFMMIPAKSVTALIGLTKETCGVKKKCTDCAARQCGFREEHGDGL